MEHKKKIKIEDVEWIYIIGYYDHPLSAVGIWQEKQYYIDLIDEIEVEVGVGEYTLIRKYCLRDLDEKTWEIEKERNDDFERWVGTHWRCDDKRKDCHQTGNEKLYYEKYKDKKIEYGTFPAVAEFEV